MAFAEGHIPATLESVKCQIHAVYATQFSYGDPEFDLSVVLDRGTIITTLVYGKADNSVIDGLLTSKELEGFNSYEVLPNSSCLEIVAGTPISPYGYYITDLFSRTGGNLTASTGDRFKVSDGIIKFLAMEYPSPEDRVWVSRKEFIESLAAI